MRVSLLSFFVALSYTVIAKSPAEPAELRNAELKAITITGSVYDKRWQDIPSTVYRINEVDSRLKLQAYSLADSLRETPGVYIQRTGPGREAPIIRGFSSSRNVIVADGVRLNNPLLREGPNEYLNTLDPFAYSETEVVMGAGSVLYGSDAAGGVVLVGSRDLTRGEAGAGWQHIGGDLQMRYSSAQRSLSEHLSTEFALDDTFSMRIGLTRQDFGDLRTGDGNVNNNTGYESWGADIRAQFFVDSKSSIVLGYDHFDLDDLNRWHRTDDFEEWHGTVRRTSPVDFRLSDFDRRSGFVRYEYRDGNGLVQEADVGVSIQYMSDKQHRNDAGAIKDKYEWDDTTYGTYGRFVSMSGIGKLTYGFDYYYDDVNSEKASDPTVAQGVVADDAKYHQFGIYLQDEIQLSERLTATFGGRFSYVRLNANKVQSKGVADISDQEEDWKAFTSSVRLVYRLSDDDSTFAYAGISQGFRAPNLSDTTRNDEVASDATESPSFDLDPEYYTTYEAGLRVEKSDYDLRLSIYRTNIDDLIVRLKEDSSGNVGKENIDGAYVTGIEISGSYDLSQSLTAFGFIAYQEGYVDDYENGRVSDGETEDHWSKMPPINGQAGLRWHSDDRDFMIEGYVNFADQQTKLSRGDVSDTSRIPVDGTPGYLTYNLRSRYSLNAQTDLAVALENISDESYRIHGSGNNSPGRSVNMSMNYRF